jgi:hypothetical protein
MAEITTDHDTVRKWAESKGGKPAAVGRTHAGGDVGIIRIMFPDNAQSEHGSLVAISWEEMLWGRRRGDGTIVAGSVVELPHVKTS